VLDSVFNQVLKLFHFYLDDDLVDVRIAASRTFKTCLGLLLSIRRARRIVVLFFIGHICECFLGVAVKILIDWLVEHRNRASLQAAISLSHLLCL